MNKGIGCVVVAVILIAFSLAVSAGVGWLIATAVFLVLPDISVAFNDVWLASAIIFWVLSFLINSAKD